MPKYDRNFTDELRERLSIVDVVGRRVPLVKKGQNYWGCCPFHNEKTPSFSVNEAKGFYHCFGCGEHGDIISFVMKSENVDFKTAITELAAQAGLKMPDYKPKPAAQIAREESYFQIMANACDVYQKLLFDESGKVALEYVRKRGFTDDMIKKYRIGYAPKNNVIANKFVNVKQDSLLATGMCRRGDYGLYDFFRDKLMFPIFNARGQIVAFSGRSLDGSEPKYINTTDTELFHKRRTIFGFNFARDAIHRANRSIVVEGQIDAIQMQCNGFPETVAPLGTALTEDHISMLCKANRNIVFCFDGDGAGQKAAARACDIVMPFLRDTSDVRFAFVTGGKDPDEVLKTSGAAAMNKIIDDATALVDFLWNLANSGFNVSTPGGRTQAEKFLKQKTDKITDASLRAEYEQEYKQRIFQNWHKWKKNSQNIARISLPEIDDITKNTLVYIVNNFPDIAERYGDFLATMNINFDEDYPNLNMDEKSAEKYIVSLKLQKYITRLQSEKKALTSRLLAGDDVRDEIAALNNKIADAQQKIDALVLM
ncbi:MAG: DNA primase [Proteobacteria bacterium]|uniref:DNA primase n=1 Tax=Candidatus Enterousia excrementavium TaxID=2840789 RepID=A0A940DEK7_9PROT|nr:DNA primase [Candidatus Enterousia excrementavium]